MTSTITPRTGSVPAGAPIPNSGTGIIQTSNVAGTNTITCDTTPEISVYATDKLYLIRPLNACTGPVTINMNGIGNRAWVKPDGTDFASGETSPNLDYLIKDNGTHFRTITPSF